jgi:hypothetical protein
LTKGSRDRFFENSSKKLLQIQAGPRRKGRSPLSKSFLLFFSRKKAFLPLALPAAAYLGSYKEHLIILAWVFPE